MTEGGVEAAEGAEADLHRHFQDLGAARDEHWESATGGGERTQRLASKMSQAWADFAHTGPYHSGLPPWPRYDRAGGAVMISCDPCRVKNHPDAEVRRLVYGS